jgi:hypothetical protein
MFRLSKGIGFGKGLVMTNAEFLAATGFNGLRSVPFPLQILASADRGAEQREHRK